MSRSIRCNTKDLSLLKAFSRIDLIHKWRLINYSFVFELIILASLILKQKILLNFVREKEAGEDD